MYDTIKYILIADPSGCRTAPASYCYPRTCTCATKLRSQTWLGAQKRIPNTMVRAKRALLQCEGPVCTYYAFYEAITNDTNVIVNTPPDWGWSRGYMPLSSTQAARAPGSSASSSTATGRLAPSDWTTSCGCREGFLSRAKSAGY